MKILFIGEKGSGKSSLLYSIFKKCDCGGIVCIPVFEGEKLIGKDAVNMANKRRKLFCRIKSKADFEGIEMENYVISEEGIKFCIEALEEAMKKELVIIDEFGILEVREKGIFQAAKKIIEDKENVIIVLRKGLEEKFLEKFPYKFEKIYMT